MPWSAMPSALARAASTVSSSPGQPGADGSYPAVRKSSIQGDQDVACSHSPWMNRTGVGDVMGRSVGTRVRTSRTSHDGGSGWRGPDSAQSAPGRHAEPLEDAL